MFFRKSSNINRCPRCNRKKSEAIQEQVSKGCLCDIKGCYFVSEIEDAIKKKKIHIVKKSKVHVRVLKKEKPIIKVQKNEI